MQSSRGRASLLAIAMVISAPLLPRNGWGEVTGYLWGGFAGDPQHTAVSTVAAQSVARIRWQTPVDLHPQYSGGHS